MAEKSVEDRLAAIEQRLTDLEQGFTRRLSGAEPSGTPSPQPAPSGAPARPVQPPAAHEMRFPDVAPGNPDSDAAPRILPVQESARSPDRAALATTLLGWGGAAAFVLAAAYLIRLGIDSGWLTPVVEIAGAVVGGLLLVGVGFALRNSQPGYAGYLPACGIVILFLSIYGGHLFYGLIGAQAATLFVVCVCALSLWLCRAFDSDLYALFAVAGSYSAPFLLESTGRPITDLVIYFSAWSVVFCIFAVWRGRRAVYLLAMYLALIGFDAIWHLGASSDWIAALVFQAVQFMIFGIATAWFSIRRRAPLDTATALAHLPPLLLFYALQYYVLDRHLPALAPWVALASLAGVGVLYFGARRILGERLPGGELLFWCYLALVLFHAGYLNVWPREWAPWASFVLVPAAVLLATPRRIGAAPSWIVWGTVAVIFLLGYVRAVANFDLGQVPGHAFLAIAYAAMLYAAYYVATDREDVRGLRPLLVYAGHVSAMAAAVHLLEVRIVESAAWALLALACLGVSAWRRDRVLGQSSLLIFGAAAMKVLLYDLSGAQPLARIISLVVLGVAFYAGGLFYRRLVANLDTG